MLLPTYGSTYSPAPYFRPYVNERASEMLLTEHESVRYSRYLIVVFHMHTISAFQIAHLSMHSLDYLLPVIIHDDAIIAEGSVELRMKDAVYLVVHLCKSKHCEDLR